MSEAWEMEACSFLPRSPTERLARAVGDHRGRRTGRGLGSRRPPSPHTETPEPRVPAREPPESSSVRKLRPLPSGPGSTSARPASTYSLMTSTRLTSSSRKCSLMPRPPYL